MKNESFIWNKLIECQNQILKEFNTRGTEITEPGMDHFNQPENGWMNRVWHTNHCRRCHIDVVDARFEKGANSVQLNDFIGKLNQQVNTTTSEINSNLVYIQDIVETQLRRTLNKSADVPYSKTDIDQIDNLLDTYTDLRVIKYKGENADYSPEEINRIRKEGTANKLIVRQKKMTSALQKNSKVEANLVNANEAGASDYISLIDSHRIMASARYDEALAGVDNIFLDDAMPLLLAVRNNADSTISELYRGADAQNLVRTIDRIYEPIMKNKVDEFYSSFHAPVNPRLF